MRHFHEIGRLHELTFSCYRRMPLLTNDLWREKLARCVEASGSENGIESVGFVFLPELVHLLVYPATPDPFSSAADEHWQSRRHPAASGTRAQSLHFNACLKLS